MCLPLAINVFIYLAKHILAKDSSSWRFILSPLHMLSPLSSPNDWDMISTYDYVGLKLGIDVEIYDLYIMKS